MSHAKDLLETIENDPDFVDSIITGDESWCFTYDPLTKWQSTDWTDPKLPYGKNLLFRKSKIKTMPILFLKSKRVAQRICSRRPNGHKIILLRG